MKGSVGEQLFPHLPRALIDFGLRYFMTALATSGLAFFVYEIFGAGRSKKLKYTLAAAISAVCLITLLTGLESSAWRIALWLPVGLFVNITLVVVIATSPERKKNRLSVLYLIGFILYAFSFFITATSIHSAPYIIIMFNFIFAVIHTILLSDRYARAIRAVEEANLMLEEKVAERTAELTTSEKSIRELVRAISHDIRTPMSVLGSNLELMKEDELSADGQRHLSVAYRKHIDLVRLVKNLTDAAGMEKGKIVCAWRPVSELLAEVNDRHAADCGGAGIVLNMRFAENCLVWVDESRVRSVFDNLIGNALRYAPEGGSISVTAENMAGGFVLIRVLDTGPGIPPEHLPRIFDPYYKADPSRGAQGSGMGLHIVKTAAEGMGGSVLAGNAPGGGFCVSVTLPAREP